MARKIAIRSEIGGWVSNRLRDLPSRGDSIQTCDTAVDRSCTTVESAARVSNARRSPAGLRVNWTAVASASDSRLRETAERIMTAAIGASKRITRPITVAIGLLLSRRVKNAMRTPTSAMIAISPAVVAATAITNVSRLPT